MSLSTYADLQAAIASWLARDDLTSYIPDFITLFEAAAARRLRLRMQETSTSLTPSSGSVSLPSDYLAWRRVTWTGSNRVELEYVHPSWLQAAYPDSPSATPKYFTIEGSTLKIRPIDATALDFVYYAKNTAISSTLNTLFTTNPDIYLFGALCEASGFNIDPEKMAVWKLRRDEGFKELKDRQFWEQGHLVMKPMGPVI